MKDSALYESIQSDLQAGAVCDIMSKANNSMGIHYPEGHDMLIHVIEETIDKHTENLPVGSIEAKHRSLILNKGLVGKEQLEDIFKDMYETFKRRLIESNQYEL